jgi:hypothetical protein
MSATITIYGLYIAGSLCFLAGSTIGLVRLLTGGTS